FPSYYSCIRSFIQAECDDEGLPVEPGEIEPVRSQYQVAPLLAQATGGKAANEIVMGRRDRLLEHEDFAAAAKVAGAEQRAGRGYVTASQAPADVLVDGLRPEDRLAAGQHPDVAVEGRIPVAGTDACGQNFVE